MTNPREEPNLQPTFNKGMLANPDSKATLLQVWKGVTQDETIPTWNQKVVKANKVVIAASEEITRERRKI